MERKMKFKLVCWGIFSLLLCVTGFSKGYAAPANPHLGKITFEQPDGKTFDGELKGDEYLNYVVTDETEDVVIQGEDGYWQYAQMKRNRTGAQASGKKYLIDEKPANALTEEELSTVETPQQRKSRTLASGPLSLTKDQNLLVVLIEFNNQKLNHYSTGTPIEKPTSIEQWHEKIFGETSKRQTLRNYYNEATQNRINLLPAATTQYNEAPGIVRVSLNEDHPNPGIGNTFPEKSYMEKALQQAEDYVDVSAYDKNNNGRLDKNELHVMFVFAGYEASASRATMNTVWGHKSHSTIRSKKGVHFENGYVAIGENTFEYIEIQVGANSTFKSIAVSSPIGLMAHEFGHDLGLPDLYGPRTTNTGNGLGYHSLMASGSWGTTGNNMVPKPEDYAGANPVHFDAYSKAQLGFPVETIESEQEISTVDARDENFKLYKLPIFKDGVKSEKEYYLIENRQIFGFDEGRRKFNGSEGISVYHVNENYRNNLNISKYGEQLVTLKEADESVHGYPLLSKGDKYSAKSYFKKENELFMFNSETIPTSKTKEDARPDFALSVEEKIENVIKINFKDSKLIRGTFGTVPWTFDPFNKKLTFKGGALSSSAQISKLAKEKEIQVEDIEKIVFTEKIKLWEKSTLFRGLSGLKEIENIEKVDVSNVSDLSLMFSETTSLRTVDLSKWDTSKVTSISGMFSKASALESIDLSNWKTSNLTQISKLFEGTTSLKHVNVNGWDTSKVENMSGVFFKASAIETIDLSDWNTSKVKNMNEMFSGTSALQSVNLSGWDTTQVTVMYNLFRYTPKLTQLEIGEKFRFIRGRDDGYYPIGLNEGSWINKEHHKVYNSGKQFIDKYDGSAPGVYEVGQATSDFIWEPETKTMTFKGGALSSSAQISKLAKEKEIQVEDIEKIVFTEKIKLWEKSTLFRGLSGLKEIENIEKVDVSNVSDLSLMFSETTSLRTVDLSKWDTSKVTSISGMFSKASALESIDLSNWKTSNLTQISKLFEGTTSLKHVNVNGWDTSKVENMSGVFFKASAIETIDLSDWNTSKVKNMNEMFSGTSALQSVNLSGWDTTQVTVMYNLFRYTPKLTQLEIGEKFRFIRGRDDGYYPIGLNEGSWINKEHHKVYNSGKQFIDKYDGSAPGVYEVGQATSDFIWEPETKTMTFKGGALSSSAQISKLAKEKEIQVEDIEKIVFTEKIKLWEKSTLFRGLSGLKEIENIEKVDVSNVSDLSLMFSETTSLRTVDLSKWDTSKVTSISGMFSKASALESIDLSNWKTSNLTQISKLFEGTTSLKHVNVNGWDTSKVENMSGVFFKASAIETIDLSDWNTSKVKNMNEMFSGTSALQSVNLSGWDTTQVTVMYNLFRYTPKLTQLEIGEKFRFIRGRDDGYYPIGLNEGSWINKEHQKVYNSGKQFIDKYDGSAPGVYEVGQATSDFIWEPETKTMTFKGGALSSSAQISKLAKEKEIQVEDIEKIVFTEKIKLWEKSTLFRGLSGLKEIENIEKVDVSNVSDLSLMFSETTSLRTVDLSKWDTSKVTSISGMFSKASALESIDLSNWKTSNLTQISKLFEGTTSLKHVNVNGWDTSKVENMSGVFFKASAIETIDLSDWNTSKVKNMNEMFSGTSALQSVNLSGWDTTQVTVMYNLFRYTPKLTQLEIGEKFRFIRGRDDGYYPIGLNEGSWINKEHQKVYNSGNQFIDEYDGSAPGLYEVDTNKI